MTARSKEPAKQLADRVVELAFERGLLTLGCGKSVIRVGARPEHHQSRSG